MRTTRSLVRIWRRFLVLLRSESPREPDPEPERETPPPVKEVQNQHSPPKFVVERIASPAQLASYVDEARASRSTSNSASNEKEESQRGPRPPPRNQSGGLRAAL
ncbi:uncharacterized protein CcaverHIS019_0703210 [Cutaneotrichosporon cavernicola]|uniref:Uncharacterized protein n=1 Tax=Cutaneotrichosporon cavernicola TaxID=279322 RepID=A0AA48QYX8_9TREE|nr:uncharacterized protein CcaverHIS019_0703210 [Cutaneotrichosporon cavernicola]BEI94740.1 hypothetical protein CcaverHIS019_0703210 [Cutaneotrichosporon cavernicola]